jgi:hypothetical protein
VDGLVVEEAFDNILSANLAKQIEDATYCMGQRKESMLRSLPLFL